MTAITSLFTARCPTAIAGLVVAIIIDTVERLTGGALAHVGEELRKVVPPLMHGNAASAIVAKVDILRTPTASPHGPPGVVGWRSRVIGCTVMASLKRASRFTLQTAARLSALFQIAARNKNFVPAGASTMPNGTAQAIRSGIFENGKATLFLAGEVSSLLGHNDY